MVIFASAPTCQDPGIPQNGHRRDFNDGKHRTLLFACNDGFLRIGSFERKCLAFNRWSGQQPICKPISKKCEVLAKKKRHQ